MLPFTYRYFPKRMNFEINPPSNKINKFSLTILSQKHAHCDPFSSLPFLLFNKYENGLESERESVQINSSGFRFNVTFVDCMSVFVKSVFETSLSFTCLYCMDADNGWDGPVRRRFASRLYPSHGPLRFITSRSPLPREKRSPWGGGCLRYT